MLHGREYCKRILGVKPPMGRASGPPAGPIGARVSPLLPSLCAAMPATRQIWRRRHDLASPLPWIPPDSALRPLDIRPKG